MSFNLIISLADTSDSFFKSGFSKPKYLLPMYGGKTMIEMAIDTLQISGTLYLILYQEDCIKYKIDIFLKEKYPTAILCYVDHSTQSSIESCYLATKQYINTDTPLVISKGDQILEWDSTEFIQGTLDSASNGCFLTNTSVYSWKRGSDFCRSFEHTEKNKDTGLTDIPLKTTTERSWSLGTPEKYYEYLQSKFGSVKAPHISTMTRGWFIGDFSPSVLRTTQFEVGLMSHTKGEPYAAHLHSQLDEYNVLVSGKMMINNELLEEGSIFIIKKGMLTKAEFLEDCKIVCIKQPSLPSDKVCY